MAYLILGGFTSLFMLCSLFVKEKLYIGEATVATLCGVIFGPHAINIFNPREWGNVDQITLECSRIVLVVQCFAVGVELPKAYMERHWRSVTFLLVPVMTYGWLITSLFIWWMVEPLTWLEGLMVAACVTATDPVLASSVVGKGKFAKRVPKHLRDVLSAESGCNDGMAFPFIYLSYYLIHYRPDAAKVAQHWICNTILYECLFGAFYGFMLGYLGRHAIKWADSKNLIDRESFLVFYFVLALFCAGTGATLGTDDLLVGFSAGVGFSNDGWFTQKTEESHVSNVIDLLLNLAYFVYLGAVIPWEQYNNPAIGLTPWRLVVISLLVIFFRRIPIMLALKPIIPDVKTWREALFAGHFGPIGVGAIFAALLARAELETDTTDPLPISEIPTDPHAHNYAVIQLIWPITTFLVISSILVHGSSIAVFTLGKRINQFTLTMSYTQANEEGPTWMNRLPRIASTARSSMSKGKDDFSASSSMEKLQEFPPGTLPPVGLPGQFLRRQKEEDTPLEPGRRRKSKWDSGMGHGGPISQSAIAPQRRPDNLGLEESMSDTLNEKETSPSGSEEKEPPDQLEMEEKEELREKKDRKKPKTVEEPELEVYQEDDDLIVEDEEGNVVNVHHTKGKTDAEKQASIEEDEKKVREDRTGYFAKGRHHPHKKSEGEEIEKEIEKKAEEVVDQPGQSWKKVFGGWGGFKKAGHNNNEEQQESSKPPEQKGGQAAHAYQFGQTLIVEDEDGEVIKKIDLGPKANKRGGLRGGVQDGPHHFDPAPIRQGLRRMSTWAGLGGPGGARPGGDPTDPTAAGEGGDPSSSSRPAPSKRKGSVAQINDDDDDDDRIRFTVGTDGTGRRMSKQEFISQLQSLDPKSRRQVVESSDVPRDVKDEVHADAIEESKTGSSAMRPRADSKAQQGGQQGGQPLSPVEELDDMGEPTAMRRVDTHLSNPPSLNDREGEGEGGAGRRSAEGEGEDIPSHNVPQSVAKRTLPHEGETAAAARRRRLAAAAEEAGSDNDDSSPSPSRRPPPRAGTGGSGSGSRFRGNSAAARRRAAEEEAEGVGGVGGGAGAGGGETAAERRRRLAALGEVQEGEEESDSEEDGGERRVGKGAVSGPPTTAAAAGSGGQVGGGKRHRGGKREEEGGAAGQSRSVQWGENRVEQTGHQGGGQGGGIGGLIGRVRGKKDKEKEKQ